MQVIDADVDIVPTMMPDLVRVNVMFANLRGKRKIFQIIIGYALYFYQHSGREWVIHCGLPPGCLENIGRT